MGGTDAPKNPVARALRWIFGLQIVLGLLLVLGNLDPGAIWPTTRPGSPELRQPVGPGDQTRRYQPRTQRPGGRPMPDSPLPDRLTLTRLEGGRWLLEGRIAAGDAERLAPQIATAAPETVVLNSPGGSVRDALALGRALRQGGIATALRDGDICYSACPYLLAGGAPRRVAPGGSVGVHQHYFGENTMLPAFLVARDIQRGQGEVMEYLDRMGIDPLVMRHALVTPPAEIYLLLPEQLKTYRMVSPPR